MNKHISLDSIEGISIILIVIMHYLNNVCEPNSELLLFTPMKMIANHCDLLVELLFIISGFKIFIGYFDKIWSNQVNFSTYLTNRLKRIYPLYFISIFAIMIAEIVHFMIVGNTFFCLSDGNRYSLLAFLLNLLMMQRVWIILYASFNGVTWFLSVLMTMYILFFVLCKLEKSIFFNSKSIWLMIICLMIGMIGCYTKINYPFFNHSMMRGMFCFNIGGGALGYNVTLMSYM